LTFNWLTLLQWRYMNHSTLRFLHTLLRRRKKRLRLEGQIFEKG
jgi:hypothetical protein